MTIQVQQAVGVAYRGGSKALIWQIDIQFTVAGILGAHRFVGLGSVQRQKVYYLLARGLWCGRLIAEDLWSCKLGPDVHECL